MANESLIEMKLTSQQFSNSEKKFFCCSSYRPCSSRSGL